MLIFRKKVLWYPRHKKVARDRGGINSGVALGRWVRALFGWLLRREGGDKKEELSASIFMAGKGGDESILKWAIRAGSGTGNFLGIEKTCRTTTIRKSFFGQWPWKSREKEGATDSDRNLKIPGGEK